MQVSEKELAFIAVGAAFTLLVGFIAYHETDVHNQPRYESNPNLGYVIDVLDTGDHYFHPNHCVHGQTQIFTPHRYPQISGGNISHIIHHGFDSMRRPAPQDDDWRTNSPAEVQF